MKKTIYVLFLSLFVCISCSKEEQIQDEQVTDAYAKDKPIKIKNKSDLCHFDAKAGLVYVVSVRGKALIAHLGHGDVLLVDADGDGYVEAVNPCVPGGDCVDTNAAIYPGATEVCGGLIDYNCDGQVDDCGTYVPDDNFELALINLGYDTLPLDDYVPTENIETILSLFVSSLNISDLTGIEDFTALRQLGCTDNQLTSLDLSTNTALTYLICYNNQLTSLDVSNNTALTSLVCYNNQLTSLDLSINNTLTTLQCHDNQLISLDLSTNTALTSLHCYDNLINCIQVNSTQFISIPSGWFKDAGATYSLGCPSDVYNPITGKTWMDRNLGASQVATSSTDAASYGDLYQWGRDSDGHQIRTSGTTTTLSGTNVPGHSDFILSTNSPNDWRSPQNTNLWQGVTGVNNPCPAGYRIPTAGEWEAERLSWSTNNTAGAFASPLKLPASGYRHFGDGTLNAVTVSADYWSSTVSGTESRPLVFQVGNAFVFYFNRAYGFACRCIKD